MLIIKAIVMKKKNLLFLAVGILLIFLGVVEFLAYMRHKTVDEFVDPNSGIIVIDPGHGGIDGGTSREGILEKDLNLDISLRLRAFLQKKGYKVVMTREEDISLDHLNQASKSRHQRDLSARADIINHSNAQLFVSIHVNANIKNPYADGAYVYYSQKYTQNESLAYFIQRAMNEMTVDGKKRTVHQPVMGNFFLLYYGKVPGAIVETAFITTPAEFQLLQQAAFRTELARAIGNGVEKYLNDCKKANQLHQSSQ